MRPISVIVPARDEELRLPPLLALLTGPADAILADAGFRLAELIVVDDGSKDGTAELVRRAADRDDRVRLIRLREGRGKGAALRAGVLEARAPLALLMDADLATPLEEVAKLGAAIDEGYDVAIGSRALRDSQILVHQPWYRELAGKTFNVAVRRVTGLGFHDTQCGFKLFQLAATRVLFEEQRIEGFAFDVEILVAARRRGLAVAEVAVRWIDDPQTRVHFFRASARMSLDLARIAGGTRRSRRERPVPSGQRQRRLGEL